MHGHGRLFEVAVINEYIDVHMAIMELLRLMRDWLYQQPHRDEANAADLYKMKEVLLRLEPILRYMEGTEDDQ